MRLFDRMTDCLRLTVAMGYDVDLRAGRGYVGWEPLSLADEMAEAATVTLGVLYYGRMLTTHTIDREMRLQLFQRVGRAARAVFDGEQEFLLEEYPGEWVLHMSHLLDPKGRDFRIVLHPTVAPFSEQRYRYIATLKTNDRTGDPSIDLDMGRWGYEKILMPGSVGLVLADLCRKMDVPQRLQLGALLRNLNALCADPEKMVGHPGAESKLVIAAASLLPH